ncbi:MAG: hypothetical protein WAL29_09545 [Bacteroidales bacterium]
MNKNDRSEIDISLKDFPDNLASLIKESLDSKNSVEKLAARSKLVRMGKIIIPKIHKLLSSENPLLRMEAAKIVELIADRRSIQGAHHVLLSLLNENEKNKLTSFLLSLDNARELGETAPVEAAEAIKTIFKRNNTI